MNEQIPFIVEDLYLYYGAESTKPVRFAELPSALWAFYQGLRLGVQIANACREEP